MEFGRELNTKFISPSRGLLDLGQVTDIIVKGAYEEPESYRLIIGTDSKNHSSYFSYVTVVILYRIGKGGIYFYQRHRSEIGRYSLQACIYQETALSLATAAKIDDLLKKKGIPKLKIEIHSDIGNHGKTKELIQEVVSWINASGYTPYVKPESFGASTVADKHTD